MALRTSRERIRQTLAFELGGLILVAPAHALATDSGMGGSTLLIAAVSLAALIWAPIYNTLFDRLEWHITRRSACQRPVSLRLVHAVLHEASALIVTVPVIMTLTDYAPVEIATLNVVLSLFYAAYAWAFHFAYDSLRPVSHMRTEAQPCYSAGASSGGKRPITSKSRTVITPDRIVPPITTQSPSAQSVVVRTLRRSWRLAGAEAWVPGTTLPASP